MIRILYTILLVLVFPFFFSWFLWQACCHKKYRQRIAQRFGFIATDSRDSAIRNQPTIWVHAASMGEVLVAESIITRLTADQNYRIFITTNTDTGYDAARTKIPGVSAVFQAPFDFPWIIQRFLNVLQPDLLLLIETELWPNMLHLCHGNKIPIMLANGRISDRSYPRYKKLSRMLKPFVSLINHFAMQSGKDADRIQVLGAPEARVTVTGNVKFDRQMTAIPSPQLRSLVDSCRWRDDDFVLVAGSTHNLDEDAVIEAFQRLQQSASRTVRLIIAPRHLERSEQLLGKLKDAGLSYVTRSAAFDSKSISVTADVSIVVLDVMGELAGAYSLGHAGFVGGTIHPVGGHNLLEPASLSLPVLFGPHTSNCQDVAKLLIEAGGAVPVATAQEMADRLKLLAEDRFRCQETGANARKVVADNQGAVDEHIKAIKALLRPRPCIKFRSPNWLMQPLAGLFSIVARARMLGYDKHILSALSVETPVICVGNIAVGGTGKTPMVAWLLSRLLANNIKPVVVSRGYGGSAGKNPVQVPADADYRVYGDEPVMLSNQFPQVPVIISHDRFEGATYGLNHYECQCIVLDDGFQHRRLNRDFDLVMVDARRPFSYDHFLPRGRLRESPMGLARANAIVFSHCETIEAHSADLAFLEDHAVQAPTFQAEHSVKGIRQCRTSPTVNVSDIPQPVALVSAIGSPEGFLNSAQSQGLRIGWEHHFSDHAAITARQWIDTAETARKKGCLALVTTSKDETRITDVDTLPIPVYVLEIEMAVSDADRLERLIMGVIRENEAKS